MQDALRVSDVASELDRLGSMVELVDARQFMELQITVAAIRAMLLGSDPELHDEFERLRIRIRSRINQFTATTRHGPWEADSPPAPA